MEPVNKNPQTIDVAAQWLARRDRGLTATEQDAYLQWLREKPEHGATIARLEQTWRRLDPLRKWRPAHSPRPNPDLLAPRPRRRRLWLAGTAALAAAAALVVATVLWRPQPPAGPRPGTAVIHPGPEHMALEDGSVVELKAGARVEVQFTPAERRVRLVSGEAHFIVAKNPRRPFIVAANNISVRAVGTAFSVQLGRAAVSVLVTEGKVRLDQAIDGGGDASLPRELSPLVAGQQAVVSTDDAAGGPALQIRELTPAEIERALAWQGPRLEFVDMRLSEVVAEFNRYNARKLVVGDRATADILVGGNFRADNVDSFVRLLDVGFGVAAVPRGDEIVLRRRR